MKCSRTTKLLLLAGAVALTMLACQGRAAAQELLTDPGFEDPRPLLPEDPTLSDPWRRTFFTTKPMTTSATVMPKSGVEHASLTQTHSPPGSVEPNIDTAVFAGFGGAASITDFTGETLQVSVEYKVVENSVTGPDPNAPGTYVRMYLSFFGPGGFLGFGSFADEFVAGTNSDYVNLSIFDTVPNFGSPVTIISYNLAVPGQFQGAGVATVYFDDASLTVVPEPASAGLAALGLAGLAFRRRRL